MKVIIANTQKELVEHFMIRGQVFIIEQEIDWAIEFDGLDHECVLFNAYIDDTIVGAARLYHNKVGRVATLKQYRKHGVGTALMDAIESYAKTKGINTLVLNAQLYIKDFYDHLGYIAEGDIFQEAEIDHIRMIKKLS
ncbi:GNAT family N-acetyltransferase [Candidatus Xianfuyuplasma coldseepsis]|uniref:GNAT family N-acetyltransferase n=1 Tax=Candidatus Xianfuyuplasma coldseepsis TaxID=2782163 RepID=A0A7L7KS04_9MOLU|nr:GNAT family N-acetyltransferase [Xianfuyuplasma coldseepsis]QMS85601.1 GNAT family N-acetyltransferase [Xianfuyuplasma coldseepsis]